LKRKEKRSRSSKSKKRKKKQNEGIFEMHVLRKTHYIMSRKIWKESEKRKERGSETKRLQDQMQLEKKKS